MCLRNTAKKYATLLPRDLPKKWLAVLKGYDYDCDYYTYILLI